MVRIPGLTYFRSVFLSGAVLVGGVGHTWALRDPEQQLPSPSEFVFGYYSPRANAANFCSSMPKSLNSQAVLVLCESLVEFESPGLLS